MTAKELILQEMEAVPEPVLAEVLDFLRFLKAKRSQPEHQVTIVSEEGETTVPLTALAEQEPGLAPYILATPMPIKQMCDELKQALNRAGYNSREKVVELVREVRQEMLAEQESEQANHA